MNTKLCSVLAVIALIVAIVACFLPLGGKTVVDRVVGAAAGPDMYEHITFLSNYTAGGNVVATSSTAATYTLTTKDFNRDTSLLSWTANVNTTLTTMASTSEPFVSLKPGQSFSVYLYAASTTAASTITLGAGTGVDLQEDEGETVIINGLEIARLTFLKKADTDIVAWLEIGQVGD